MDVDVQGHLRRRDTALMAALPLLTLAVLLWSLTIHPYCHVHLACDGPDDPSKMRILWPAAVATLVAIGALVLARVSHVRASSLAETRLSLLRPQNRRADRLLVLGAATNAV